MLILASNELVSKSVSKLPWTAGIIYEDLNTFLRNTHMQLSFSVSSSINVTVEDIKRELEGKVQAKVISRPTRVGQ